MFMLIYTSSWIINLLSIDGFILQDTYNVLLKDSADYKVDLIINADDYEMIDKKQFKDFTIDDKRNKFNDLDELAVAANNNAMSIKPKTMNPAYDVIPPLSKVATDNHSITNAKSKGVEQLATQSISSTQDTSKETAMEYDYDNLINEYEEEANNESRSNNAYEISKSDVNGIGLEAVKCLIEDCNSQLPTTRDVAGRLWKIFQIWFLVYLAVAIPLWCTRGWCCCCLFCKFFKPRQTIEEARKYVFMYPPGVFKTKNGVIRYEPSERERECYEEFEHFIKTL